MGQIMCLGTVLVQRGLSENSETCSAMKIEHNVNTGGFPSLPL